MTPEDVRTQLKAAKQAHEAWKMRLLGQLEGKGEPLDPLRVGRDDLCDFGCFLHGKELEPWIVNGKPHEVITRLHREFHGLAAEVARHTQAGNTAAARETLNGPYREASKKLFLALNKWDKELSEMRGRRREDAIRT